MLDEGMRPFEVRPESQGFSFQAERIFTAYVFPLAWDNNKNLNNKSNPKPPIEFRGAMQFTTQVVRHGCYVTAKFIYEKH